MPQPTPFDIALQDFVQHVGNLKQQAAAQAQMGAMPQQGAPTPPGGMPPQQGAPGGSAPGMQPMPQPAPANNGVPSPMPGDLRDGTANMLRVMMEGRMHANMLAAMLQGKNGGTATVQ